MRNPYRFTIDPDNGTVYVGDVGWNTWEMLNVFPTTFANPDRDRNAGWPCYEGGDGVALPQPDFEFAPTSQAACQAIYSPDQGGTGVGVSAPLYGYRHDAPGGENGSAITAGPKYVGTSNYPAQYVGQLFIGDYARDRFQTVDPTTGVATDFGTPGDWGNPVDIQIAPDGNVAYLAISTGELREIVYTGSNHVPVAVATATQTSSPTAPFTAQFDGSESSDADPGDTLTYDWDFADGSALEPGEPDAHVHERRLVRRHVDGLRRSSRRHRLDRPLDRRREHRTDDHVDEPVHRVSLQDRRHDQLGLDARGRGRRCADGRRRLHAGAPDPPRPLPPDHRLHRARRRRSIVVDHGSDDTYYEVITTATDHFGRSTTATFDILPDKQPVSITSTPPGAVVSVDGVQATTPYNFMSIVNGHHEVDAPVDLALGGNPRVFDQWTQGSTAANTEFFAFDTRPTARPSNADYSPTAKGLSVSDGSVVEGDSGSRAATLTVSLSGPSGAPVSVDYATVDGSGTEQRPRRPTTVPTAGHSPSAPGVTSQAITVAVNGDGTVEPDEHFGVVLSNPHGAPDRAGHRHAHDHRRRPRQRAANRDRRREDARRRRRHAHRAGHRVALRPEPRRRLGAVRHGRRQRVVADRLRGQVGNAHLRREEDERDDQRPDQGDGTNESSEAFAVGLSNPVGATIARAVGLGPARQRRPRTGTLGQRRVERGGQHAARASCSSRSPSRRRAPRRSPSITWCRIRPRTTATWGRPTPGRSPLIPGKLTATFQVKTLGDTSVEPNETYQVTLSNPVNAPYRKGRPRPAPSSTTIRAPGCGSASDDAAISEGNSGQRLLEFTITLSDPAPAPVTISYATAPQTATAGTDYTTKVGIAKIAAGKTGVDVVVTPAGPTPRPSPGRDVRPHAEQS